MSSSTLKRAAATAAATLGIVIFLPTASASAIDRADCGEPGVVRITMHVGDRGKEDLCYKNTGKWSLKSCGPSKTWFDQVSTGDYEFKYTDCDGPTVSIPRNTIMSFPNHPPAVKDFTLS